MPPADSQEMVDRQRELTAAESVWKSIQSRLEDEQRRVHEEIKHYPRPIPACDLQFNHLLEERAGIARELDRLREAVEEGRGSPDPAKVLGEFVRSTRYIDDGERQRLLSSLGVR